MRCEDAVLHSTGNSDGPLLYHEQLINYGCSSITILVPMRRDPYSIGFIGDTSLQYCVRIRIFIPEKKLTKRVLELELASEVTVPVLQNLRYRAGSRTVCWVCSPKFPSLERWREIKQKVGCSARLEERKRKNKLYLTEGGNSNDMAQPSIVWIFYGDGFIPGGC